jgi:hypothetical protein
VSRGRDLRRTGVLTYREIAEFAFRSLGKPARITAVPVWVMRLVTAVTKSFSKHQGELLAFYTTAMTSDVVAPTVGLHSLEAHFERHGPVHRSLSSPQSPAR